MLQAQIFNKERGLANSLYKLLNDKELSVAYIGGSVTDGYGSTDQTTNSWAAKIGNWLEERYPDAKISNTKYSIGGTGSYFAAFRYEREIAATNPDLIFIEYAINDRYNGVTYDQVVRSTESIVRLATAENPYIDIVFVLTFDSETRDSDYEQLSAHRDVANYYGLPYIKLADKVYSMLSKTGDLFNKYFQDNVHPNDNGYLFYAHEIWSLVLSELIIAENSAIIEYKKKALPAKTLAPTILKNARMLYTDEIGLAKSNGWEYQPKNDYSWLGRRYNGRVFAQRIGSKLTFEFEGTDIGIASGIGPNMGIISVTVDDREPVVIDDYQISKNPKDRVIAENLSEGKHTVTIEVTGKNDLSDGCEFEIGAILLS